MNTENLPAVLPIVEEQQPNIGTLLDPAEFSDIPPERQETLGIFLEGGGKATKEQLLDSLQVYTSLEAPNISHVRKRVSALRKSLQQKGKTIKFISGESSYYEIVDEEEVLYPNGEVAQIRGEKQKSILKSILSHPLRRITYVDEYPDTKSPMQGEANLFKNIKEIRKKLPTEYAITSQTNDEGVVEYTFEETTFTLPSGIIIKGLTPQTRSVLNYLVRAEGSVDMEELTSYLKPGVEYKKARSTIRQEVYKLRRILTAHQAGIKLASEGESPNASYQFFEATPQKTPKPKRRKYEQQQGNTLQKIRQLKREYEREEESMEEKLMADSHSYLIDRVRSLHRYDGRGVPEETLTAAGYKSLETARQKFNPKWNIPFEDFAMFWIRGAMGNEILSRLQVRQIPTDEGSKLKDFRDACAVALVDLSCNSTPQITSDEARAIDILLGITGRQGDDIEASFELGLSTQWINRHLSSTVETITNSSHGRKLAYYLHS